MNGSAALAKAPHSRFGFQRYSSVELLWALIALFVITPFVEDLPRGDFIEGCAMSIVLVSAVLAIGGKRKTLRIAAALVTPALIGKWLHHIHPNWMPPHYYLAFALIFIAFVVGQLLRFILSAARVDGEVLCASISVYLMIGLLWTMAYMLVDQVAPESFSFSGAVDAKSGMNGFNAFYFSFVTLSTVGFGDVTPVSKLARMLAMMEAITGTLYVTVLIARLVAMYVPTGREAKTTL